MAFGKDFRLISEATLTGLDVGADKDFWGALAHNKSLFAKIAPLVKHCNIIDQLKKLGVIIELDVMPSENALQGFAQWFLAESTNMEITLGDLEKQLYEKLITLNIHPAEFAPYAPENFVIAYNLGDTRIGFNPPYKINGCNLLPLIRRIIEERPRVAAMLL